MGYDLEFTTELILTTPLYVSNVSDVVNEIAEYLNNESEKTLLLSGIADKEKHRSLLQALNSQGNLKGVVLLIHTTIEGIEHFFRWAELYEVRAPKKYRQAMHLSNLTIYFDKLLTTIPNHKFDSCAFDFMIIWPIQSVTKNEEELQQLGDFVNRQKTKKIILLTIKEPWYDPEPMKRIVDRVIKLDCEEDNPLEYRRVISAYSDDIKVSKQRGF